MTTYGRVLSRIWSDQEFIELDPQQQLLYVLLLSHPKRNHAGVLSLTLRQWAMVTATATSDTVRAALMRLAQTRFVVLDWDIEEVLIRTYIRNDNVHLQPKVMKCAIKQALETQSPILRNVIADEIQRLDGYENHQDWRDTVTKLRSRSSAASAHVERLNPDPGNTLSDSEKPSGVGSYLSEVEDSPIPVPHNHSQTHNARAGEALPFVDDDTFDLATSEKNSGLSRPAPVGVSHLVDDLVPPRRARGPERSRLILAAADVNRVYGIDITAKALRKWVDTSKGAQILMSVASDVNAEGFHAQYPVADNGRKRATTDRNWYETQARKDDPSLIKSPMEVLSGFRAFRDLDLGVGTQKELPGGSQ